MYTVRQAAPEDIPVIVGYRILMFKSFLEDNYDWEHIRKFEIDYFSRRMADGRFAAWVAETGGGVIVATSAVSFYETAPKPWNLDSQYAFISSMYTEPEHRRKGLGGELLQAALRFSSEKGVTHATLHASQSGKHLYESAGFRDTNEMRMKITDMD